MKPRPIKIIDGIGYVPLTQGKVAIVDAEDVPLLADRNWFAVKDDNTFYAATNIKDSNGIFRFTSMHRFLLSTSLNVDHEDLNGLNNRRNNLRPAGYGDNAHNCKNHGHNTSGFKGVSFHSATSKWQARLHYNRQYKHLGVHDTLEDAARAYDKAAREHFGEFARLNFPREGERGAL